MAQEDFTHYYAVTGMGAGAVFGPAVATDTTLVELASDGDGVNGSTAPFNEIEWLNAAPVGPYLYVGLSNGQYPIIEDNAGARYVTANDGTLEGAPVNPDFGASYTYCFAAGTNIATPEGDRAVETLAIGDLVLTADGRTVAVKWLGHQTIRKFLNGARIQPVRIRAGALGDGLPQRDLVVTGEHGMVIDGLVINAAALVNGNSIDWVPLAELGDIVTYYHVETEDHDVILAEGAPAETFIDYLDRRSFDNYAEYLALYGAERIIPEMDRPRISAARLVPASIRKRLGLSMTDSRPAGLKAG